MMNEEALARLEWIARERDEERVYEALRSFSVRDVGELLLRVPDNCPALRTALPTMPSDRVQINWNGNSGAALLEQSLSFIGTVATVFASYTRRPLDGARILDYGCGWGRLIRLMYKFSGPDHIYGCDAWASSLDLCKEHRIRTHLAVCAEVPAEMPFPGVKFDLIYAYSVLTHLSERTARAVMGTFRRSIEPGGLCVITVRPPEYWDAHPRKSAVDVERIKREHAARGFAFTPHYKRAPVDGEITYGDASISIEYIEQSWPGWSIASSHPDSADPLQRLVFLRPD